MWNASLSTMWALSRAEPFADFFLTSRMLGFSHQELNHAVTAEMLAAVAPGDLRVESVHEPCPCPIPRRVRQERGIHMSSLDELLRRQAVDFARGSIQLAHRLGAKAVVVHPGEVPVGKEHERRLKELRSECAVDGGEAAVLRERFIEERRSAAASHIEALHRSLLQLVADAEQLGVQLGIENRDHFYEIPLPDEMSDLLALRPGVIAYWHDTGHGEILESLGFNPHSEWLERFGGRMVGIHLHDFDGEKDHIAPGLGAIDWEWVGGFIPADAIRTFEIRGFTTPEQVRAAQEMLQRVGCIERIHG